VFFLNDSNTNLLNPKESLHTRETIGPSLSVQRYEVQQQNDTNKQEENHNGRNGDRDVGSVRIAFGEH
jgi:hypothetical protein